MAKIASLEEFKEYLKYSPETGELMWIKGRRRGRLVSCIHNGYYVITFKKRQYKAHRVAWLLFFKNWPKGLLDHIDGNSVNNKIVNLREVTPRDNQNNRYYHRKDALPGATFHKGSSKWASRIAVDGLTCHLGLFLTKEEAHNLYKQTYYEWEGKEYANNTTTLSKVSA